MKYLFFIILTLTIPAVCQSLEALKLTQSEWLGLPGKGEITPGHYILVESEAIFNNYEWTSIPESGRTDFGLLVPLSYRFISAQGTEFQAGVIAEKWYGDNEYISLHPFLSLLLRPAEAHTLRFGMLSSHDIHPALLDPNLKLTDTQPGHGMQWQFSYPFWDSDAWLDWREREEEDQPEQFEVAWANKLHLGPVNLYLDILSDHTGGENNSSGEQNRNYGGRTGAGIVLSSGDSLSFEPGISWLAASYTRNGDSESGSGLEFYSDYRQHIGDHWKGDLRLHYYWGQSLEMENGFVLYGYDEFGGLDLNVLYSGLEDVQVELGSSFLFAGGSFHTTQSISVNWKFGHRF